MSDGDKKNGDKKNGDKKNGDKKNGASIIDKLLDRLGYRDGAWRRAFVSGLIFLTLVAGYGVPPFDRSTGLAETADTIKELLKSTQALMVVTLLIFASGFVIDGVSRGFLVRGVSVTASCIDRWSRRVRGSSRWGWRSWFVPLATCLLWPLMILVGTVLSTGQVVTLYRFGLRLSKVRPNGPKPSGTTPSGPPPPEVRTSSYQLTKRGRALFKRLPQAVREGLDEPYGDKFDAAWQGLSVIAPAEQRQWINRLA